MGNIKVITLRCRDPVLILQGNADSFKVLPEASCRHARTIPGAVLREFAGNGHYLQYSQPKAVDEAVRRVGKGVKR
jgi:pimeloyl-ACP methyl ester carboxylesterase